MFFIIASYFSIGDDLNNSISIEKSLRINEIHANPVAGDNNKEFVEVFGHANLSDFLIGDLYVNDSLIVLQNNPDCNYSLIVEEGFNYENLSCSVYSSGATIGNGLSNSADQVFLYFNETLIDNVSYTNAIEGESFSFVEKGNFSFSAPTPCKENFGFFNETVNVNNSLNKSINTSLNISLNESLNNSLNASTNINFSINNSINNSNNSINNSINSSINNTLIIEDYCNVSLDLSIKNDKEIYFVGDKIKFYNYLSDNDYEFIISYWIVDYFNNTVKSKIETANTYLKQWTIKTDDKYGIFKIKNNLTSINCSNVNNKTSNEKFIFAVNKNYEESAVKEDSKKTEEIIEDSVIEFSNVKLDKSELDFYVDVFKGETRKRLLNIFIECKDKKENVLNLEKIKTYFYDQQSSNKFGFSLILNLNECVEDLKLCADGLDNFVCYNLNFSKKSESTKKEIFSVASNETSYAEIKTFSSNNNSVSDYFDFSMSKAQNYKDPVNIISGSVTKDVSNDEIYTDSKSFVNYVIIGVMIILLFVVFLKT